MLTASVDRFHVARGDTCVGILPIEDILGRVQNGELDPFDHVYDEEQKDWIAIIVHPVFAAYKSFWQKYQNANVAKPAKPVKSINNTVPELEGGKEAWFVLKGDHRFGPFEYLELVRLTQAKELNDWDYVWTKRLPKWTRISSLSEFHSETIQHLRASLTENLGESLNEVFFRRRFARAVFEASILVHNNQKLYRGRSIEMSAGGLSLVLAESDIKISDVLHLHVKPSRETPAFNSACEVMTRRILNTGDPKSPVVYGLKFVGLEDRVKTELDGWATRRSALKTAIVGLFFLACTACGGQKFSVEEGASNFGQQVTYSSQVDVLWVIDTSGSMVSRQTELAKQIPAFIDGLNATGLDYQIGVTTMDMQNGAARGRLISQPGTPLILNKSTPRISEILAERIQAGEAGSPTERGREALMSALAASGPGKYNEGFLRENALLDVIFLSDEEDKSDNTINYVASLDSIKPVLPFGDRSWVVHFIGVTTTDASCKTAQWNLYSPGIRYMDLANASGGASESICDADFRRALGNVRSRVLEMLTEFPLDRKPNESTIKVSVNGVVVKKDSTNGWSYRASVNSIRFHGNAIPVAGARIAVTFDPEGLK